MKIQNSIKAAVAALLIGAASQAAATTVSINASGLPGNPLTNGTYQGSFNGSEVLPGQFLINSIGFSFTFADDSNDPYTNVTGTTTYETTTSATAQGQNRTFTTTTIAVTPVTSTGQGESVLLSFSGVNYSGQTTAGATTTTSSPTIYGTAVKGADVYVKNGAICTDYAITHDSSCKLSTSYTVSATRTDTTSTDYTGNIALSDSLLSYDALLASLQSTKSLNFSLGITGDINLTSASLSLDYTETPEPGSLALFGIALLGAAGVRRARRG